MLLARESEVEMIWEDGGVRAPISVWITSIVLAMAPVDQNKVLDEVVRIVKENNAEVEDGSTESQSRPNSTSQDITTEDN